MTPAATLPTPAPAIASASTAQIVHDAVVDWLRNEGGVPTKHVDHDTPLVSLGIDSLGIATIGETLEKQTGKRLHSDVVFDLESIRELAEHLDSILPYQEIAGAPSAPAAETRCDLPSATPTPPSEELAPSPDRVDPAAHYERLNRRVRAAKQQGVYFFEPEISAHDGAWVTAEDRRMLMLSSYEYLGLLGHPHLQEAAVAALENYGTGHHGARLLVGTTTVHKQLEAKLAGFMDAEDALVFGSGYVANLATISALVGPGDCIVGDQFNHASIADGCRMSGAELLEFKHNDMASLAEVLARTRGRRTLVIVDAVFSMEGDIADLPEIVALCRRHGALLMVDEAHSVGVLGERGRGIQEHFDLDADAIDIKMGTLSKALAGSGGFVAGRESLITYLRHHARGYIFSGALPACQAAASIAALEVLEQKPELVEQLWQNAERYVGGLKKLGFDTGACQTPIVPIMTGNDDRALAMTGLCRAEGLLVVPVCFPAVPVDAPRLRTCVSAIHTAEDIDFALDVLARAGRQAGAIG
ncbi:MAG: 8-amino-7-oxononanoate synthase [Planctomycetota bacterium]|nr:MAG: 8-amino-7-oxononanoate synthase [Planctomycetota bacterium]